MLKCSTTVAYRVVVTLNFDSYNLEINRCHCCLMRIQLVKFYYPRLRESRDIAKN